MAKKKLIDVRHPFFRPLWRRVALTVLLVAWTLFEITGGSVFWILLFGVATAFIIWEFFVVFDPANYERRED